MPRRPLVLALIALVVALLLTPIVLLLLAGPAGQSVSEDPAQGSAGGDPVLPELRLEDVGWVYAAPLFQGPAETYTLQAGLLSEPAPLVDLTVPMGVDPNVNPGRRPAVGPIVGGSVVYVADNGARASVRRVTIAPIPADEELAILDEIVYSIAVAPDGGEAYVAVGDREDAERDLGILRVSLDGLGRVERIFEPDAAASVEPAIIPAAVVGFHVDIAVSLDGRHLVRNACAGPAGCATQVIDLESRAVTALGDRRVLGVAGGIVLAQRCGVECTIELIDAGTGAAERLPGIEFDAAMVMVGGEPRVAFVDGSVQPPVLVSLDVRDGSVAEVFRAPGGSSLTLSSVLFDVRIALPAGYVLAEVSGQDKGAIVEMRTAAIPVGGGRAIELPSAPFRQEFFGVEG